MQLAATALQTGKRPMAVYALGMIGVAGFAAAAVLVPGFFRGYGTLVLGGAGALYAVALTVSMRPRTRAVMLTLGPHGLDDGAGTRIARADVAQAFVREAYEGGMVSNVRVPATPPALEVIAAGQHLRFGLASVDEGGAALEAMGLPRVIVPASYVATVATSAARTQGRRAWVLSLVVMLLVLGLGVGSAVFLSRRAASAGGAASATTVSTGVEARPRAPLVIKRPPAPAATQPAEAPPRSATATAPAPTSKAGPPPALTVGPATDAQGALSAEVITRVVRARYSALAACIADAGDERGATTVTLVIATSGAVTSTQVASSTRRFATCAARVLRSLKFPTGDAITKVSVPLSLADQPR